MCGTLSWHSLVLHGTQAIRRVKCYTSHPLELQVRIAGSKGNTLIGEANSDGGLCGLFSCNGRIMKNNETISRRTRLCVLFLNVFYLRALNI